MALIPLNVLLVIQLEWVMNGPYLSHLALVPNAIVLLLLLVGGNHLLRRRLPNTALNQAELIVLYTMVAISTGLAGCDGVPILNQLIPYGVWYGAGDTVLGALPDWLVIKDREAVRGHYLGNSTLYTPEHLRAWAVPTLAWTGFVTVVVWTVMCGCVLVRRQWQERERLAFPVIWLPLEMTDPSARFFANRLMWSGFTLAAGLGVYNGIAYLYPAWPSLPIRSMDLKPLFTAKPWSAIDWLPTTLYPIVIGLGYLLPLDLLFSCVFFFFFWKAQRIVANVYGWDATPEFPFVREQAFGALLCLGIYYLWTGRRVLAETWRAAWTGGGVRRRTPGSAAWGGGDALSPRAAWLGLGVGLAALALFCIAAGMRPWLAAAFLLIYLAILFIVVRIRAELGPPIHDFHFTGPDRMLPRTLGVEGWRTQDLGMLTLFWFNNRAHRGDVAPFGMEGLYAAHKRGWEPGRVLAAVMLAVVTGAFCAIWLHEHQAYRLGETAKFIFGSWAAREAFDKLSGWMSGISDLHASSTVLSAMGVGVASCLSMLWARLRFLGFPLHPIGYLLSSSWSIHLVWLPLSLAWIFKALTMRWGGLRAYRQFLPFFLGLILGDCVPGCFWGLVSLILQVRTYSFFGE